MTTRPPPAGWYPDPSGKPGQTYWDGLRWHEGMPATSPSPAARTPGDNIRPYVDKARPHWDKVRRFWSGLSPQRQVMIAIAALIVVVGAVAVPITALGFFLGGEEHSPSYQAGYASGSSGMAHTAAIGLGADFACQGSFAKAQLADRSLVAKDYVQGCLDGLRDHPPGS